MKYNLSFAFRLLFLTFFLFNVFPCFSQDTVKVKQTAPQTAASPDTTKQPVNVSTTQPSQAQNNFNVFYLSNDELRLLGDIIDASTAPHVNVMTIMKIFQSQMANQPKSAPQNTTAVPGNKTPKK